MTQKETTTDLAFEAFIQETYCNPSAALQLVKFASEFSHESFIIVSQIKEIDYRIRQRDDITQFLSGYFRQFAFLLQGEGFDPGEVLLKLAELHRCVTINSALYDLAPQVYALKYANQEQCTEALQSFPYVLMLMILRLLMGKLLLIMKDVSEFHDEFRKNAAP